MRVDFYVAGAAGGDARLQLACRILEKAFEAGQPALVYAQDAGLLARFDELLWTFADTSFVPHQLLAQGTAPDADAAPVLLATGLPDGVPRELLLNLAPEVPGFAAEFARVVEVLDDDPEVRAQGRDRFRSYRRLGVEPQTHRV